MAKLEDIQNFLASIQSCDKIDIVNTAKNRQTRYELGITVQDQEDFVRSLTASDYKSGPEADRDSSKKGNVWIFKKVYLGTMFYIKLKEVKEHRPGVKGTTVLSCHIDNIKPVK